MSGPRLVFGDDGSASADVVWSWIESHPWPGWLVSVVTAQPPSGPPVGAERAALRPWTPPSPRVPFADDVDFEHLRAEADPRIVLDSCTDAALVAVGPRGQGALKHLHIGSTTDWLLSAHRPLTPVVVVRSPQRTRRVLLCVDGSVHARQAAKTFAGLPWAGDCSVTVLGATGMHVETEPGVDEVVALLREAGVRKVEPRIEAALELTATFDVRSVILDAVEELEPDLVVMGTRGLGAFRRMVLGSTARAVVHHAPCSVLVVRAHDEE